MAFDFNNAVAVKETNDGLKLSGDFDFDSAVPVFEGQTLSSMTPEIMERTRPMTPVEDKAYKRRKRALLLREYPEDAYSGVSSVMEAFAQGILPIRPTEVRTYPEGALEEIHPVSHFAGKLVGLIAMSKLTAPIAPGITKALADFSPIAPTLFRMIPHAVQRASLWGGKEFIDQTTRIMSGEDPELGKRVGQVLSSTGFGLLTGGIAGIEGTAKRIIMQGIGRGGWVAGEKLLKERKLDKDDLLDISLNAAVGMALEAVNARNVSRAYREAKTDNFLRNKLLTKIKRVHPEYTPQQVQESAALMNQWAIASNNPAQVEVLSQMPENFGTYTEPQQYQFVQKVVEGIKGDVSVAQALANAAEFMKGIIPQVPPITKEEAPPTPKVAGGEVGNLAWTFGAEPFAAMPGEAVAFLGAKGDNFSTAKAEIIYDEVDNEPVGYKIQLADGSILPNPKSGKLGGSPYFETMEEAQDYAVAHFKGAHPTLQAEGAGKVRSSAPKPASIKPDVSGITPLRKQIEAMEEREGRVQFAQDTLDSVNDVRRSLRHRIKKYAKGDLQEELAELPTYYVTKEKGITPDEAMEELRNQYNADINNEAELVDYLKNLESERKYLTEEVQSQRPGLITKRETTLLNDKIKAVQMGIREGRMEARQEVKAVQTEIISMIEDMELDANDRAKFMRALKNVQTTEQLAKALPKIQERIDRLVEAEERRGLVAEIKTLSEKQESKSLPIEYKDAIGALVEKLTLKGTSAKTKARLEGMRSFVQRMQEQGEEVNIQQEQLDLLGRLSLDQMTTEDLQQLKTVLERLYHQGRLKNKLLTAAQGRTWDALRGEMVSIITGGAGISEESTIVKALRSQNERFAKKPLAALRDFIVGNLRPELMLNILDGMEVGVMTDTVFNTLWEAQKSELNETQKVNEIIHDIHKKLNIAEVFGKKYDIGRFKGMTKDMALFIYANSFNDANRLHLEGSGVTEQDITDIGNFLSADEKKAVADMIRFYDQYQWPILDKIYSSLEGVHLGKEEQYYPIDRLEDVSYNKELEQEILQRRHIRKAGVSKGWSKARVTSKRGFSEFSYFGTILRNMHKVEHYKAFAQSVRDVNKVLNNPEIKASIEQKYGEEFWRVLDKWHKDVAFGGNKQALDKLDKIARWLRTNYATAVLGFNFMTMMKQPLSFMQGSEMAGKWHTTKALQQFLTEPFYWNEAIAKKSVLMKNRFMQQERELNEIRSQRSVKHRIGKVTGYQWLREKSMLPIAVADKATCNVIWLASYNGALEGGMTETKAVNHADMVIRRTQPMSGTLNLPDTFRGSNYQKLFTIFRNQPNQNFNLLTESILKKGGGKIGKGEFMSHLVFYTLLPAMMFGLITRKRPQENIGELARDILNGAFGGVFLLGNVLSMLAMGWLGSTSPLEAVFQDLFYIATAKKPETRMKHLMNLASTLSGFPLVGLLRAVKGEIFGAPPKSSSKALEMI